MRGGWRLPLVVVEWAIYIARKKFWRGNSIRHLNREDVWLFFEQKISLTLTIKIYAPLLTTGMTPATWQRQGHLLDYSETDLHCRDFQNEGWNVVFSCIMEWLWWTLSRSRRNKEDERYRRNDLEGQEFKKFERHGNRKFDKESKLKAVYAEEKAYNTWSS